MTFTLQRLCAWSGIVAIVLMGIGFVGLAGFLPPPSPDQTATAMAHDYLEHRDGIRFGLILTMGAATLLLPFTTVMTLQMRRIEGRRPTLALINFGVGTLFVLEFLYLVFFWQTATFRPDRAPELIQLLIDMAWIPFVGLVSTAVLQAAVFGIAILCDTRTAPIFPRWLGYYNLWAALLFTPGTFNVFFKTGPLAWNGIIAIWLPIAVFFTWMVINAVYLNKAVDHEIAEEAVEADAQTSLADEVASLRADVERLSSAAVAVRA